MRWQSICMTARLCLLAASHLFQDVLLEPLQYSLDIDRTHITSNITVTSLTRFGVLYTPLLLDP
jgi:hypothetical protein